MLCCSYYGRTEHSSNFSLFPYLRWHTGSVKHNRIISPVFCSTLVGGKEKECTKPGSLLQTAGLSFLKGRDLSLTPPALPSHALQFSRLAGAQQRPVLSLACSFHNPTGHTRYCSHSHKHTNLCVLLVATHEPPTHL